MGREVAKGVDVSVFNVGNRKVDLGVKVRVGLKEGRYVETWIELKVSDGTNFLVFSAISASLISRLEGRIEQTTVEATNELMITSLAITVVSLAIMSLVKNMLSCVHFVAFCTKRYFSKISRAPTSVSTSELSLYPWTETRNMF